MTTATLTAPKACARFAGICYLGIFILAIFANFTVFLPLVETGDAAATAANITENEGRFRLGIVCFLLVLILDIFIAWALYLLLSPVSTNLSLLTALFRLAYTIAEIGVVLYLVSALSIIASPEIYSALQNGAESILAYHFLTGHGTGFTVTLIFFGVHLLLLGYLIIRSSYLPTIIGALVMLAGLGYLIDGFGTVLIGDYDGEANLAMYIVVLPALIGEGALMLWLIIMGVNRKRWDEAQ